MNKISVILTTYNVENYIEECLDSLNNQTFKDFELIILDDGSTDNTVNVIRKKYLNNNVILKENKNIGVAKERNEGISIAGCEYICFLDSDDYFERDMLEKLYNSMKENKCDLSISSAYKFDDKTKEETKLDYMLNRTITNDYKCLGRKELTSNIFQLTVANAWAKMFKRSVIIKNNLEFQDLKNSNDVLFVFSYMVCSNKISFVSEPLVHYRFNNSNSIQGKKKKYPFEFLKAYETLQDYLISNNYYEIYKQSFIKMVINVMIWNIKTTENERVINLIKKKYFSLFRINEINNKDESYNELKLLIGW